MDEIRAFFDRADYMPDFTDLFFAYPIYRNQEGKAEYLDYLRQGNLRESPYITTGLIKPQAIQDYSHGRTEYISKERSNFTPLYMLFEIDSEPLAEQEKIIYRALQATKEHPFIMAIVFSGNKSYHCIAPLADLSAYSYSDRQARQLFFSFLRKITPERFSDIFDHMNARYFKGKADENGRKYTQSARRPNGIRQDEKTGYKPVVQRLIYYNPYAYIDASRIPQKPKPIQPKAYTPKRTKWHGRQGDFIAFLRNLRDKRAKYCLMYLNGEDAGEDTAYSAIAYLMGLMRSREHRELNGALEAVRLIAENAKKYHPSNIGRSVEGIINEIYG